MKYCTLMCVTRKVAVVRRAKTDTTLTRTLLTHPLKARNIYYMNTRSCNCAHSTSLACDALDELPGLLKILSERNRLRLLFILRDGGEHCVCEFENHTNDLSQSLISHHLADLKKAGLVSAEKRGLNVHYVLSERGKRVTEIVSLLTKQGVHMCNCQSTNQNCCCVKDTATDTGKCDSSCCCTADSCQTKSCCSGVQCDPEMRCKCGHCKPSSATKDDTSCC